MVRTPARSDLRIADLKRRVPAASRMMTVHLPADLVAAIERLAKELKASKTEVVVALLNAGLHDAAKNRR